MKKTKKGGCTYSPPPLPPSSPKPKHKLTDGILTWRLRGSALTRAIAGVSVALL